MKPVILLSFAALALPVLLAGQSSSQAPGANSVQAFIIGSDGVATRTKAVTINVSSCPVAMQAKQGSGSGLVMVRRNDSKSTQPTTPTKPSQRIHLILGKMPGAHFSNPEQIIGATVTVKGLSARDHFDLTLDPSGSAPSDLHRTMNLAFSVENDGSVTADLNLPGFTAVNSIKLDSVELKDGSTWTLADLKACVVTPDRMMLVANQ